MCTTIFLVLNSFIIFIYKNSIKKYKKLNTAGFILLNILIRIFGMKLTVTDTNKNILKHKQIRNRLQNNKLIVSNHLSYLDIALMQSIFKNNCFISHFEVKQQNPILYFISKLSGSYFIERRNLKNIRKELRDIADILKSGVNMVLFPEGTSTNGSGVLPFHAPFFSTVNLAHKDILPICINYTHINNEPFNINNRDRICWYKDHPASFLQHLFAFFELKSVKVNITFCDPIKSEGKNSRTLTEESHQAIKALFQPIE